ncbi:hypothetical protein ScalyP_jg9484 [Parmales sp. scaly parma]|nr:hypothetical protein ScalyP_jg9484 [Parmales sp. scaly parma]
MSSGKRIYTSCFCEENVYKILEPAVENDAEEYAVFVSNNLKECPLAAQRSGSAPVHLVVWDYHVFHLYRRNNSFFITDYDSTLFPSSLNQNNYQLPVAQYISKTFRFQHPQHPTQFRVVPKAKFLAHFSSDRSHMLVSGSSTEYQMPIPPYAPLGASGSSSNLMSSYVCMDDENNGDETFGEILSLARFTERFTH